MDKIKAKLTALFTAVVCLFACVGIGVAVSQPKSDNVTAKAATTEELTAEFTNNGQFTVGLFREDMPFEIVDSTAEGVPEGASGAVLKITGVGDDGSSAGGAFATLDFTAAGCFVTGTDVVVRVYQPSNLNFRVSKTAGSAEWKTQTTLAAGWTEVTLSAATNATEDHQIMTTMSMGFRRGTECYIDSVTIVDNDLKKDFTNDGQFDVKQYSTNRTYFVDGSTEGLPEGYEGAVLKLYPGDTQYVNLDFSGSGLKASDVASMSAKCYLPNAYSDGAYTDSNYEFRLNSGENTAGGAGAYDMSTWFVAPINVAKIATDADGFLTTVTIGLRNKGNTASYFYIDGITVEEAEYNVIQVGEVEVYGTNATNATRLYLMPTDQTVTWHDASANFTWHSGLGFEQVRGGEVIQSGHLTLANRNTNAASASNIKHFYLDIQSYTKEAGDIFRFGGTYCNVDLGLKYVIEDSEVLWDGTSFGKNAEYTTLDMGKLTVRSGVSTKNRIYGTPANYTLANMPHKSWNDAFYLYSGDGMKINDESTAIKSMNSTGEGVTFTFPDVTEADTVLSIGGTFRCPVQKLEYTIDESKFVWNGSKWEAYVEYTTYNVGNVKFSQVGGDGNRYVYLLPVSTAGFDTTTWNSGWTAEFSWKDGVGVTLNDNDVGAVVKFPGSFFIDLGAAPAVGDILRVGGTYYNASVAKEYIINEAAFQYNGTAWEIYYDTYTVTEVGAVNTSTASVLNLYSLAGDELPKDKGDWDNVYLYGDGASVKLNDTEITAEIKMPGDLYVPLGQEAQVGDCFTINGTFYNETKAIKLVFVDCKLYWDGTAWVESYEPPVVEYEITELGTVKVHGHSAGTTTNKPSATALYMKSSITLPFTTWSDKFTLDSGDGWKLNGNAVTTGQLVSADGNLYVSLANANVQVGDVLSVSGTFVHTTELAKYVIEESKFIWTGLVWENYLQPTEYEIGKLAIDGGSSATAVNFKKADDTAFEVKDGTWAAKMRFITGTGVGVTLNGTQIENALGDKKYKMNDIKLPNNMYVGLGTTAVEGDKLVIGGTFYFNNGTVAANYVIEESKFIYNGTAWEKYVEYAEYTVGEMTFNKVDGGNKHAYFNADIAIPTVNEWLAYTCSDGVGATINGENVAAVKFPACVFIELSSAPNVGDELVIGGTFYNETDARRFTIAESTFWWDGTAWATEPPVMYTVHELGALQFQKVGGENKFVYLEREDGVAIPNSDWAAFTLESGEGVKINDASVDAVVKFPSVLFIEFASAPAQGDKLTISGTFYNEELMVKYVVPETTLYWDEGTWDAVNSSGYTEHTLGELLVRSPSAAAGARATQLYLKQASGAALPYPDSSWNTEFAYQSGMGVCLNGEWITIIDLESTNDGLFLNLSNAGVKAGDVLTIGGTYKSADVSAKYVITESSFMWNGTFWVNYVTNDKLAAYDVVSIQDIGLDEAETWEGTVNEVQHDFVPSTGNTTKSLVFRFGFNCADVEATYTDDKGTTHSSDFAFRVRGSNWYGIRFDIIAGTIKLFDANKSYPLESNTDYVIEIAAISLKDGRNWTYVKVDDVMVLSEIITTEQFKNFDDFTGEYTNHFSIYANGVAKTTLTDPDGVKVAYVSSAGTHTEKVKKDQLYTLAEGKTTKTFIGWVHNGVLYAPGTELTVTQAITFTAVEIDFTTEAGAAMRIGESAEKSGIRFTSQFNETEFNALIGQYGIESIAYGTLIIPYDSLAFGQKPNLEDFDPEKDEILKIESTPMDAEDGYVVFRGAMQDLYEGNYGRFFAGRAYMEITFAGGEVWTIYTPFNSEDNVRSIRIIAKAFKADTSDPQNEKDLRYHTLTTEKQAIVDAYIGTEEIKLMNYDAYEANAMSIIAWNFPELDPTDNYVNDANIAVANTMKEAGIKVIGLTGANIIQMDSPLKIEQTRQIINFFWSQGIGTFAFQHNGGNTYNVNFAQAGYPDFSDCEGFMGFLAWDEPSVASIDTIATQVAAFEAAYAGTDVIFMGNLLPSYASIFNPDGVLDKGAFKAYLQKYCDVVLSQVSGTKWLSIDTYPILANKTLVKNFLYDIGTLKTVALENDAHAHVILQSYGYVENGNTAKERMPSEAELRMQAYTAMAFGVDSMSWYVYSPNGHGENDTAVDVSGTVVDQENYDAFKNINAELTAIGKVYNAFNWKGIILGAGKDNGTKIGSWELSKDNDYKAFEMVTGQLGDYELSASDTKHLSSVKTNETDLNYLMGVMEDAYGNEGYVLCNYNSHEEDRAQTITLTFDSNITEVVIYRGGVAQTVSVANKTLTVDLATGEGVIILPSKVN